MLFRALLVLVPPLIVACAGTSRAAPAPGDPLYDTWEAVMVDVVDPDFQDVLKAQAKGELEAMDLAAIALAARRSARAIALGHGSLEDRQIADFARMSREAEAWFMEIATLADRGDRETLRRTILDGERMHCDRCHEAAEHDD